jgi:hypothetical protein
MSNNFDMLVDIIRRECSALRHSLESHNFKVVGFRILPNDETLEILLSESQVFFRSGETHYMILMGVQAEFVMRDIPVMDKPFEVQAIVRNV